MSPLENFLKETEYVKLLPGITPLEPLFRLGQLWGSDRLYVKRDDMTGVGLGGNKIRSLQYILGEAIEKGFKKILVSGPEQSNLCMLTAAACAKLGLSCEVIHNSEEPNSFQGNLLLNQILGVKSHFIGPVDGETRNACMEELGKRYNAEGVKTYVIRNGATTGRGALGYAAAAVELELQCREEQLEGMTIFIPGGNGGVAAGLIYGNAMLGLPFRIIVISVEDDKETLNLHIEKTIEELEKITGLSLNRPVSQICEICDDYRGEGWGKNTEESSQMIFEFACHEGIFIENVYDSKVLVGMKNFVKEGKVTGNACYLHTGGLGSLFDQY